jgi:hypothetical protein
MKYKVAVHRSDEGISVSVPALPGCWSEGDTGMVGSSFVLSPELVRRKSQTSSSGRRNDEHRYQWIIDTWPVTSVVRCR